MTYLMPANLNDALTALSGGQISVIAGGTDWFPSRGERAFHGKLLNVTRINGMRGIAKTDGGWRIGGTTTWTDIVRADLPAAFKGLQLAAREVGSVQIQNAGTVAGNICNASPAADGVPPLLALNAEVELASIRGTRRMPLAEFITGPRKTRLQPDELISALHIPDISDRHKGAFVKIGARKYLVISITMVAAIVSMVDGHVQDARVAVGSASPVAKRLPELEAALIGATPDTTLKRVTPEVLSILSPISDIRGSAEYRKDAIAEAIRRALSKAMEV